MTAKTIRLKQGRPTATNRKAQGVTPLIAIRLPSDLRKKLERAARQKRISLSDAVRDAIAAFVEREPGK